MQVLREVVGLVLYVFFILLIGRLVLDWVQVFARSWRPRGIMLVIAETIYSITDPPLKLVRRIIPPVRIGTISLDLAFLVLMLAVSILMSVIQ